MVISWNFWLDSDKFDETSKITIGICTDRQQRVSKPWLKGFDKYESDEDGILGQIWFTKQVEWSLRQPFLVDFPGTLFRHSKWLFEPSWM